MRVLVIADHDPATFGDQFEADILSAGWREGAGHCTVEPFSFSHCEPGISAVWRRHAAQAGGYWDTAFLDACEPSPDLAPYAFAQDLAQQFFTAVNSGMSRVVVALPRFLEPDAGVAFLFALGRLVLDSQEIAQVESVGRMLNDHQTWGLSKQELVNQLAAVIAGVRAFCADVDVVGAYASNMPLMGMHGMSGAAALEEFLEGEVAQDRERQISELFHLLQEPYGQLGGPQKSFAPAPGLLVPVGAHSVVPSLKDLTRHDGAGAGGGLGFALLTVGARMLPAATVFATQFDLRTAIAKSDLVVVYQNKLDGRTFPDQVGHWAAQVATEFVSPVIVITHEQIMSVREMSGQQVASAYLVDRGPQALQHLAGRLAKSWTPNRQ